MPKGNLATARAHRQWLNDLPTIIGKPLTKIAQESKVAASTLTRPVKEGEDGISTLHATTIAKVVETFGVAPPPGAVAPSPGARRASAGLMGDAVPYEPEPGNPLAAALEALRAKRNGLAFWQINTRALELAGILPGDVVLVDLDATPAPGDPVCAEVKDWKRGRTDTIMRIFERAAPIELLTSRSLDPALQDALVVDRERVTIKGVLLPHRLRASTPAAA